MKEFSDGKTQILSSQFEKFPTTQRRRHNIFVRLANTPRNQLCCRTLPAHERRQLRQAIS